MCKGSRFWQDLWCMVAWSSSAKRIAFSMFRGANLVLKEERTWQLQWVHFPTSSRHPATLEYGCNSSFSSFLCWQKALRIYRHCYLWLHQPEVPWRNIQGHLRKSMLSYVPTQNDPTYAAPHERSHYWSSLMVPIDAGSHAAPRTRDISSRFFVHVHVCVCARMCVCVICIILCWLAFLLGLAWNCTQVYPISIFVNNIWARINGYWAQWDHLTDNQRQWSSNCMQAVHPLLPAPRAPLCSSKPKDLTSKEQETPLSHPNAKLHPKHLSIILPMSVYFFQGRWLSLHVYTENCIYIYAYFKYRHAYVYSYI